MLCVCKHVLRNLFEAVFWMVVDFVRNLSQDSERRIRLLPECLFPSEVLQRKEDVTELELMSAE